MQYNKRIQTQRIHKMRTLKELWVELAIAQEVGKLDQFMDSLSDDEYKLIPIQIRLDYYKTFDFTE